MQNSHSLLLSILFWMSLLLKAGPTKTFLFLTLCFVRVKPNFCVNGYTLHIHIKLLFTIV